MDWSGADYLWIIVRCLISFINDAMLNLSKSDLTKQLLYILHGPSTFSSLGELFLQLITKFIKKLTDSF